MTLILPANAPESQLMRALDDNMVAFMQTMTLLPGSAWVETPTHLRFHTFPNSPFFSGVYHTKLNESNVDATIEEVIAWFKERGAQRFFWWLTSFTEPANLADRLVAHGLTFRSFDSPYMLADLTALPEPAPLPAGIEVFPVTTQEQLEAWHRILWIATDMPPASAKAWADATLGLGLPHPAWRCYMATLNGEPVATSLMFMGGGSAGLYGVGTLPEARGKGIGAAVTLKPILDARAEGYQVSVLFASRQGYSVYKRIGYRDMNLLMGRCLWVGEGA